jgi:lipid II:glycine glycyltransferase (peptidoglycan interpeptide bridge formation enzyme)
MPTLIEIDPTTDARWDELVAGHPQAVVYQLSDFAEILHRCYGFEASYIGLEDDQGRLIAGLPLMQTRGLYRGARVVSLPLAPRAGPITATDEDAAILLRAACARASELRASFVMRSWQGQYQELVPELVPVGRFPSWVVRLPADPDELRRRWRASLRQNVDQSAAFGLSIRDAENERDLRRFYRLYVLAMKRHGAAARPFSQIRLSWRLLGRSGHIKVLLAERKGTALAGALLHLIGKTVELRYVGSDARHHAQRPNHALYWNVQRWAIENGYETFDMGGGDGSLAAFKRGWGAEPVPWTKYAQHPAADGLRQSDDAPATADRHPTAFLWRRFPAPLASAAGAVLYRYLADPSR